MSKLDKITVETSPQVFHSLTWNFHVSEIIINELISKAKQNQNNKARLCLHPTKDSNIQVTYLAFIAPYKDKIHQHPIHPEIIIPVIGKAKMQIYDDNLDLIEELVLEGSKKMAVSNERKNWHALVVDSDCFVMVEIGGGPFTKNSTVYFS